MTKSKNSGTAATPKGGQTSAPAERGQQAGNLFSPPFFMFFTVNPSIVPAVAAIL
jgi:hypothetical protein